MIGRYIRAFFTTLRLTIRGETAVPPLKHPQLHDWARHTVEIVDSLTMLADRSGLDKAQREQRPFLIDKRTMTLETAVQTLRHHAAREYPYLLKHYTPHSPLTIQAINLNDQYLATRLLELEGIPPDMKAGFTRLLDHLRAIPAVHAVNEG
jgi:hypothetical protein